MPRQEKIKRLQQAIEAEEERINDRFRAGKIPEKDDYREIDRLKRALRSERIQATKEAKRTDPLLDKRFSVKVSEAEYDKLLKIAEGRGVNISDLIRGMIREHLFAQVEGEGENKG
ncbi:MAG: ribbon-helix-helix protein, CopG family [Syntrophales bacterium]|nr:ribbon-helix-helix protein, CopG family [Syntrophales bacterium]